MLSPTALLNWFLIRSFQELCEEGNYFKLSDILKATKLVFSRLPFVTVTLAGCMANFIVSMVPPFMPKILQSKFGLLPGSASLLYGCSSVPAALLGNLTGEH